MTNPTYVSSALIEYINKYRSDAELVNAEQSMIADAMCGLEIAIFGMHVDERTSNLLRRAMSVVSSYHWMLEMMQKEK